MPESEGGIVAGSPVKEKKARILEVALRLFNDLGYHETTLDEVAKQADIAKGTLYLYFKSKDDLFIQCMFDGSEKWMLCAREIMNGTGDFRERLRKLVQLQIDVFTRNGPLIQQFIMRKRSTNHDSALAKRMVKKMRERLELFAVFFKEGIESGDFSDSLAPMQMAIIFHQVFDLNMKFRLFDVPALTAERCSDVLLDLFTANKRSKR